MKGPTQDWTRAKIFNNKPDVIALPEGIERIKAEDEAAIFEIVEVGPEVTKVVVGSLVIAAFMHGVMKFRLPEEKESSFAIKESDVLYVIA